MAWRLPECLEGRADFNDPGGEGVFDKQPIFFCSIEQSVYLPPCQHQIKNIICALTIDLRPIANFEAKLDTLMLSQVNFLPKMAKKYSCYFVRVCYRCSWKTLPGGEGLPLHEGRRKLQGLQRLVSRI